jgi:hypothetical protein
LWLEPQVAADALESRCAMTQHRPNEACSTA